MSPPRRRRRRRRRGTDKSAAPKPQSQANDAAAKAAEGAPPRRSRGRRRGRRRTGDLPIPSPKSSEDLVRAWDKRRPETITAPPDGQTLEGIVGDLQSVWGVPQYPQEYRITIKIAEERDARGERAVPLDEVVEEKAEEARPALGVAASSPRREKAPAAPRVSTAGGDSDSAGPRRRGRRRRRRGRGGSGSGGS